MKNKLTLKQEKFCREYIINNGNGTKAYREAYNCSKMSEKSINENASRLLKYSKVISRLNELKNNLQKKFEYTVEQSFTKLENVQTLTLNADKPDFGNYLKAEDLIQKITGLQKQVLMGDKDNPISISSQIVHNFVKIDDKKGDS